MTQQLNPLVVVHFRLNRRANQNTSDLLVAGHPEHLQDLDHGMPSDSSHIPTARVHALFTLFLFFFFLRRRFCSPFTIACRLSQPKGRGDH